MIHLDTIYYKFLNFAVSSSGGGEEGGGAPELINWVHWWRLGAEKAGNENLVHFLHTFENTIFFSLFVILPVCLWAFLTYRKVMHGRDSEERKKVPKGFSQNFWELVVSGLSSYTQDGLGLGKRGLSYVPFIGSLFLFILLNNLLGMVPLMKSSTSSLNITLGLAVIVFLTAQIHGIRALGVGGWLKHLAGVEEGSVLEYCLMPLMFPLHVVGEIIKPISLSLRLFGNIFGEDILLAVFVGLGAVAFLPLQTPFYFLALLTSFIQTMVFTLLACSYIQTFSHIHDDHAEAH